VHHTFCNSSVGRVGQFFSTFFNFFTFSTKGKQRSVVPLEKSWKIVKKVYWAIRPPSQRSIFGSYTTEYKGPKFFHIVVLTGIKRFSCVHKVPPVYNYILC
jgi:hypothetical protein